VSLAVWLNSREIIVPTHKIVKELVKKMVISMLLPTIMKRTALYEMDSVQHVVKGTKYPAVLCVGG
jgi:hypothetical protein